jgi:hypothetical protein
MPLLCLLPVLANEMRGANNVEICAIESFDIPEYTTQEELRLNH